MGAHDYRPWSWRIACLCLLALSVAFPFAAQALDTQTATTAATAASTTTTATTLPATNCSDCHGGTNVERHHSKPEFLNGECSKCHVGVTASGDCSACHTFGLQNTHHASDAALAGNCAQCHTNVGDYKNCLSCHQGKTRTRHHEVAKLQTISCKSCHTTLVSDGSCRSCHTTAPRERHHTVAASQGLSCKSCHTGIVETTGGCKSCHDFYAPNPNPHHSTAVDPYGLACLDCHPMVWDGRSYKVQMPTTEQCVSCHTTVVGTASIAQTHHMTLPAQTNQCTTCHQGVTPVTDCTICHSTAGGAMVTRHHSTPIYQQGACTTCHVGAEATGISCAACHAKGLPEAPAHHQQPDAVAGNCKACHTTIQTLGTGCASCHTAPIPEIHHGTPLQTVGGNCGACHQSVSDPKVCANCHQTSSPHHTTTWSQQGDCTHCHKVPAYAAEHPKQAACRECHGPNQHNKGGPIKDYGACRSCHDQVPFHPAPGRTVGYTVPAAGKGRFAYFWKTYAGGRSEVRPDIKPNGDDLGDEGGYKWSKPTLSFNTVQISRYGNTYVVPSFDPLNPAPTLADCTRCHADQQAKVSCTNTLWTNHVAKQYVKLATYQLAEQTYLGSLCAGAQPVGSCTVFTSGTYIEAEKFTSLGTNFSVQTGSGNGGSYLRATLSSTSTVSGTPVSYTLQFPEAGTYYIWFRGNDQRNSSSNSIWYGLNGQMVGNAATPVTDTNWRWVNARNDQGPSPTAITVSTAGTHTLNLWARESNFWLDGIYLTKASGTLPGGVSIGVPTGAVSLDATTCGGTGTAPTASANLALNKTATASRYESGYEPGKAVDGNATTRWWARSDNDQYLRIDLGNVARVSKVTISWGTYYAEDYQVSVSRDGSNWSRVVDAQERSGGNAEHTFTARDVRYVRVYCTKARSSYGYAINELGVFQ